MVSASELEALQSRSKAGPMISRYLNEQKSISFSKRTESGQDLCGLCQCIVGGLQPGDLPHWVCSTCSGTGHASCIRNHLASAAEQGVFPQCPFPKCKSRLPDHQAAFYLGKRRTGRDRQEAANRWNHHQIAKQQEVVASEEREQLRAARAAELAEFLAAEEAEKRRNRTPQPSPRSSSAPASLFGWVSQPSPSQASTPSTASAPWSRGPLSFARPTEPSNVVTTKSWRPPLFPRPELPGRFIWEGIQEIQEGIQDLVTSRNKVELYAF
mmetsp:Transcript_19321/g.45192  ORF Transcript_19321/g.45192 Transcript_19321/m.45192 type:complete len:269 (+) Transcript_19321:51-857(+)